MSLAPVGIRPDPPEGDRRFAPIASGCSGTGGRVPSERVAESERNTQPMLCLCSHWWLHIHYREPKCCILFT